MRIFLSIFLSLVVWEWVPPHSRPLWISVSPGRTGLIISGLPYKGYYPWAWPIRIRDVPFLGYIPLIILPFLILELADFVYAFLHQHVDACPYIVVLRILDISRSPMSSASYSYFSVDLLVSPILVMKPLLFTKLVLFETLPPTLLLSASCEFDWHCPANISFRNLCLLYVWAYYSLFWLTKGQ